jgi:hypothetical protein
MPASSLREEAQATVSNKHGHRGEHEVSRKTIARGMPGRSGVTVVTTLVCLFSYTRGCGRIARPAFPAPSDIRGREIQPKTRAESRGEIAESWQRMNRYFEKFNPKQLNESNISSVTENRSLPLACHARPL